MKALAYVVQLAGFAVLAASGWFVSPALGCISTGAVLVALGVILDWQKENPRGSVRP